MRSPSTWEDGKVEPFNGTESHLVSASGGLDAATLQLEKLVEETHMALARDNFVQGPVNDSVATPSAAVPSLDAVDRALEELQRGLAEIDGALASTSGAGGNTGTVVNNTTGWVPGGDLVTEY